MIGWTWISWLFKNQLWGILSLVLTIIIQVVWLVQLEDDSFIVLMVESSNLHMQGPSGNFCHVNKKLSF